MISEFLIQIFAFAAMAGLGLQFNWSPVATTNATDMTWITTCFLTGKLVGYLILAPSLCLLDGKTVILLGSILLAASWVVNGFFGAINVVLMGRFMGGVSDTVIYGALLMYLVEKSDGLQRKFFIGCQSFLLIIGSMVQKILESYTSHTIACLLCAVFVLVIFVTLFLTISSAPDNNVEPVQDDGKAMVQLIVRFGVLSLYFLVSFVPVVDTYIYDKLDHIPNLFPLAIHLVIQIITLEMVVVRVEESYRIYLRLASLLGTACSMTIAGLYLRTSHIVFLISATVLAISVNLGLQTVRSIKNKFYSPNLRKVKVGISEVCTCGVLFVASKMYMFCANEYGSNLTSFVFLIVCVIVYNVVKLTGGNSKQEYYDQYNRLDYFTLCQYTDGTLKDGTGTKIAPI